MPSGIWGSAICKDIDLTDPSRGDGKVNVGLLLVPAWDFNRDGVPHGHMAIIARKAIDSRVNSSLVVDVPVSNESTLYRRWGDWFVWLVAAYLLFAVVSLASARKGQ